MYLFKTVLLLLVPAMGASEAVAHSLRSVSDNLINPIGPDPPHSYRNSNTKSRFPTVHDSAVLARRMLRKGRFATLSTVFPDTGKRRRNEDGSGGETGLQDPSGLPIGLADYYADCGPDGSPVLLSFDIGTTFRNVAAGSNISLSLDWGTLRVTEGHGDHHPPRTGPHHPPGHAPVDPSSPSHQSEPPQPGLNWNNIPAARSLPQPSLFTSVLEHPSPAALPRFSIQGHLEPISDSELALDISQGTIEKCYLDRHPDAGSWLPGNRIHSTRWARLVVEQVYWIGGFGNVAYIGWIDGDEWRSVTEEEISKARLPGEQDGDVPEHPVPPPPPDHPPHHPPPHHPPPHHPPPHHPPPHHPPHHPSPHHPPPHHPPHHPPASFCGKVRACFNHDQDTCPISLFFFDSFLLSGWLFFFGALLAFPMLHRLGRRQEAKKAKALYGLSGADEVDKTGRISPSDGAEKEALLGDAKW